MFGLEIQVCYAGSVAFPSNKKLYTTFFLDMQKYSPRPDRSFKLRAKFRVDTDSAASSLRLELRSEQIWLLYKSNKVTNTGEKGSMEV